MRCWASIYRLIFSNTTTINNFLQLGGFDPAFGKGYFEDTDLAFRVRNLGYHVVIQPMSLAYHQEGSTLGNEDSSTRQVLFERGMQAFRNKWGQETKVHFR